MGIELEARIGKTGVSVGGLRCPWGPTIVVCYVLLERCRGVFSDACPAC